MIRVIYKKIDGRTKEEHERECIFTKNHLQKKKEIKRTMFY